MLLTNVRCQNIDFYNPKFVLTGGNYFTGCNAIFVKLIAISGDVDSFVRCHLDQETLSFIIYLHDQSKCVTVEYCRLILLSTVKFRSLILSESTDNINHNNKFDLYCAV